MTINVFNYNLYLQLKVLTVYSIYKFLFFISGMHVLMHAKLIDFVLFVFKYTMQITSMMEESDFNDARL